jgi:hypothetical protein
MAAQISSVADFEAEKSNPQSKGRAFEVPQNVFDHYINQLKIQPISSADLQDLSNFLGKQVPASGRIGLTRASTCTHCGHTFSFTDHFRAAVNAGVHTKSQLEEFTVPKGKYYLVIDTDDPLTINCPNCRKDFPSIRCCYSTSGYGYV